MVDDDTNKKIIEEEIRSPQKKQKSRQKTSWIILLAIIAAVVIFIVFTVFLRRDIPIHRDITMRQKYPMTEVIYPMRKWQESGLTDT